MMSKATDGNTSVTVNEEGEVAEYLALDRLLRYAHREALSQHRDKAACLIAAAITFLTDTGALLQ